MTREELIEELNKIKGITVKYDNVVLPCIDIYYNNSMFMTYCSDCRVLSVFGAYFENRTEQDVLSAVKGLVGQSKKSNILNFSPEIKITNVSNQGKFICFRVKGLDDGILVGLTHPELDLDDPKQGLGVGYKGEVKKACFKKR